MGEDRSGATISPQVSSAAISIWFGLAGPPGAFSVYGYLPGGRSIVGPLGDCGLPAPAVTLMVCLLMVTATSLPPMLPNISLARPGFGITSAFAAAAGFFCARLMLVSPFWRPSFSTAGPSGEVNANRTWSGLATALLAASFHPSLVSSER